MRRSSIGTAGSFICRVHSSVRAAALSDGSCFRQQFFHGGFACGIAGVAKVQTDARRPGITLPAFGSTAILPTVATRPSVRRGEWLHGNDPLGGGSQRVAAQVHGRGAGVIGLAR